MDVYSLKVAVLELTRRCNLSCQHCGSSCDNRASPEELSLEEWKNLLHGLKELDLEKAVFSGGEATTSPHFEALINFAARIGLKFGFITNGFNVSDELICQLQTDRPFAVGVSLDGRPRSHNALRNNDASWLKAVEAISRLKDADLPVAVVTSLHAFNCDDLRPLLGILSRLGIDAWQIQLAMPMGRMQGKSGWLIDFDGTERFKAACETIRDLRRKCPGLRLSAADCFGFDSLGMTKGVDWPGCSAGIYTLGVKSNGDVLPCLSMYDDKYVCGNIREKPIAEIWRDPENFSFNRKFNAALVPSSSCCINCCRLNDCRGGCASMANSFYGHLHDAPFCVDREFGLL